MLVKCFPCTVLCSPIVKLEGRFGGNTFSATISLLVVVIKILCVIVLHIYIYICVCIYSQADIHAHFTLEEEWL